MWIILLCLCFPFHSFQGGNHALAVKAVPYELIVEAVTDSITELLPVGGRFISVGEDWLIDCVRKVNLRQVPADSTKIEEMVLTADGATFDTVAIHVVSRKHQRFVTFDTLASSGKVLATGRMGEKKGGVRFSDTLVSQYEWADSVIVLGDSVFRGQKVKSCQHSRFDSVVTQSQVTTKYYFAPLTGFVSYIDFSRTRAKALDGLSCIGFEQQLPNFKPNLVRGYLVFHNELASAKLDSICRSLVMKAEEVLNKRQ